jgi:hypothetical protein
MGPGFRRDGWTGCLRASAGPRLGIGQRAMAPLSKTWPELSSARVAAGLVSTCMRTPKWITSPTAKELRRLAENHRRLAETARTEKRAAEHRDIAEIFEREADAMERDIASEASEAKPPRTPRRF